MTYHHMYKYSQVDNTKTFCLFELQLGLIKSYLIQGLNYFKHTLSNIIIYCTITGSRKLKIQCQNTPLLGGFTKFTCKKTLPYHDFVKFALKYPYFREIWNTHQTISAPEEAPPGVCTPNSLVLGMVGRFRCDPLHF